MVNKVGKVEFEKLSDLPVYKVFDLSDVLFDKFLLFFKLEAEMRPEERKERREKGLGKATALAERGGKAGEGDKMKTLEEVKELQSDLEASFAEEAEVRCNAEQVVEKFSFPLFQSLKIENRWRRSCALFPPALSLDFTCVLAATVPSIADRCTRKWAAKSLQPLAVFVKSIEFL